MRKNFTGMTVERFAKLHEVNKRTLHYYDDIGLFRPHARGENGYRYYDISQSIDFEYIRMLKELNMSIEEIEAYRKNPSSDKFLKIVAEKEKEIDVEIQKLKHVKKILRTKKEQAAFCENLLEQEITIEECKSEKIFILPYDFAEDDISQLFAYVKDAWSIKQIRMGIGGFISLDKILNKAFEAYDGIYTPALDCAYSSEARIKPKGKYLCGYQKGSWDKLPVMYEKMIDYAKQKHLKLKGYAYESGLNEFMISNPQEYITKIMIKLDDNPDEPSF